MGDEEVTTPIKRSYSIYNFTWKSPLTSMDLQWQIPYGVVTVFIGAFLLYAAWANYPVKPGCLALKAGELPVVHFTPA